MTWFFFLVCESHLTDFPQAAAWAEAEPEPAEAYEHGLGFSLEGRGREKLSFTDGFQAEPSQHNTKWSIITFGTSGYNSRANGIVERSHFDIWQALFKACDGDQSKWSTVAYSVFWAECVMIWRCMGCSPYFATTGTHPLLPFNIAEANYLLPPPDSSLSMTDLIAQRAIALQKQRE